MTNTTAANHKTYRAGERQFDWFSDAVAFAKANDLEVFQNDNGQRRWAPIPKKAAKTQHVFSPAAQAMMAAQKAARRAR